LKRKSNSYKEGNLDFVLAWRSNYCREEITTSKPNIIGNKAEPYKVWRKDLATKTKSKANNPSNCNREE
jgi:hypothetical protein